MSWIGVERYWGMGGIPSKESKMGKKTRVGMAAVNTGNYTKLFAEKAGCYVGARE